MAERFGQRPLSCWGSGDLPAPFAVGDVIDVPAGAKALERMHGAPPGRYTICSAWSIDEGDAWYFRFGYGSRRQPLVRALGYTASDRLHIIPGKVDYLAGCALVSTADPAGLALRERMLADGWSFTPRPVCPTCGTTWHADSPPPFAIPEPTS